MKFARLPTSMLPVLISAPTSLAPFKINAHVIFSLELSHSVQVCRRRRCLLTRGDAEAVAHPNAEAEGFLDESQRRSSEMTGGHQLGALHQFPSERAVRTANLPAARRVLSILRVDSAFYQRGSVEQHVVDAHIPNKYSLVRLSLVEVLPIGLLVWKTVSCAEAAPDPVPKDVFVGASALCVVNLGSEGVFVCVVAGACGRRECPA